MADHASALTVHVAVHCFISPCDCFVFAQSHTCWYQVEGVYNRVLPPSTLTYAVLLNMLSCHVSLLLCLTLPVSVCVCVCV